MHDGDRKDPAAPREIATSARVIERAAIEARLERQRVVTLVGPPGVGKTWIARSLAHDRPDCVFVDLRSVRDAASVSRACATALGLPRAVSDEGPIAAALGERGALLIVLDNAEHVLGGVRALVADLLANTRSVRVLVTSQEPLWIEGESTLAVAPLDAQAAAELLVQRAEDAGVVPLPNAAQAQELAMLLDGLPLAIELAAPRLRLMTPPELVAELSDRFGVLRDRARSLEASIGAAWERLDDDLENAAQRLAMFRGGMSLRAVEDILAPLGARPLDLLQGLVDRSLLAVDRTGAAARFHFLESIWSFVDARTKDEDRPALERAHAQAMVGLGEQLVGERTRQAFVELAREAENLLSALARVGEPELVARLALVVDELTTAGRGGWHHGHVLERAVEISARCADAPLRARVFAARARYRFWSGSLPDVAADAAHAIELAGGDALPRGRATFANALLAVAAGADAADAVATLERDYLASGDAPLLAKDLARLALEAVRRGDVAETQALLARARRLPGDLADCAIPVAEGFLALELGEDAAIALAHFEGARDVAARSRFELERIPAEIGRAVALQLLGAPTEAATSGREAALLCEGAGSATAAALCYAIAAQAGWVAGAADWEQSLRKAEETEARYGGAEIHELVVATRERIEGRQPARPGSTRHVQRLLEVVSGELERRGSRPTCALFVSADGALLRCDDVSIDLSTRPMLRRLFGALVEAHEAKCGVVGFDALVAAGWPGERMLESAARRRLQVAISTLRGLGLRALIETVGDGYRLREDVVLTVLAGR